MPTEQIEPEYRYESGGPTWGSDYLWPPLTRSIRQALPSGGRIFEVGCGNGAASKMLTELGYSVTAIDPSASGIEMAQRNASGARFEVGSAYDDLAGRYGTFPVVVSLEVVEHCFSPHRFAKTVFDLLEPGGTAIISTPYHGYVKNLALAVLGKLDAHWGPLWEGGHIKFWSPATLGQLLTETGFDQVRFMRVGRIPALAKSMIAIARKPGYKSS